MNNDRLSFKEKYSYGVGAIGKDMCCGIIFTYCMLYFTDVLKWSRWKVANWDGEEADKKFWKSCRRGI